MLYMTSFSISREWEHFPSSVLICWWSSHQLYISSHLPPCVASCWNCLTDLESSNDLACQKHMQIWRKSQSILLLVLRIVWYSSDPFFWSFLPSAPRTDWQRHRALCLQTNAPERRSSLASAGRSTDISRQCHERYLALSNDEKVW